MTTLRFGRKRTSRHAAICELKIAAVIGAILLAAITATASPARVDDADKRCNVRLKGLKTLSDPQRKLLNLHPKNTSLAAINALPQSHPTPKTRSTAFARQVWRITAQITEFKAEGDSDIHLVLATRASDRPQKEDWTVQCLFRSTTRDAGDGSGHGRGSVVGRSSPPSPPSI
jgi:hypothetical protein